MKRDIEIIRAILLNVESDKYQLGEIIHLDGVPDEICAHHVALIFDENLAVGQLIRSDCYGIGGATIERLTSRGHDFCDGIRRDTIWNKVKEHFIKSGKPVVLSMVIEFVRMEVHQLFSGVPPHK